MPVIVYFLSLLLSLVFLTLYFLIGDESITRILFNSDILYFPTLYKDLFIDHYRISGWNIPGSPNFFPDMFFYFILMFITGKATYSTYLFASFQFLAILLLFRHVIKLVSPQSGLYPLALGNLMLSLFFLVTFIDHDAYMTFHLVSNTYHLGTFVNVLIALVFSIAYIRSDRIINLIFLFFFGVLAIISDRLFIIMYCIPFAGAILIFVRKPQNLQKLLLLTLTIGIMLALGLVLFDYITHNNTIRVVKVLYDFSAESIVNSWNMLFANLLLYFDHFNVFAIIILLSILSFIISLLYMFRSHSSLWKGFELKDEDGLKQLLNLFFILFMAIVFFTPVLTGLFQAFDQIRYNIFVFYLGPLYLGVLLINFFNEKPLISLVVKFSSYIFLFILTIYLGFYILKNQPVLDLKKNLVYYPEVANCIDILDEKYELKHGVSTYWLGKVGTLFSKRNIRLYTIYDENLVPYPHVGNENWYYKAGYGKYDPPVFNFILLKKPVNESGLKILEKRLGKIILTEDCGNLLFILVNDFKYTRGNPFPEIISLKNIESSGNLHQ